MPMPMPMEFSKNKKYNIAHIYIHNYIYIYINMELRIDTPEQQAAFDDLMKQLAPAIHDLGETVRQVDGRLEGFYRDFVAGRVVPQHIKERFLEADTPKGKGKGGMRKVPVPATKEAREALAKSLAGQRSPGSPRRGSSPGAAARPPHFDPSTPVTGPQRVRRMVEEIEQLSASGVPLILPGKEREVARRMLADERGRMAHGLPSPGPAAAALAGEVPCQLNPVLSFAIDAVIVLATCAGSLYLIDVGTGFLANFFTAFRLEDATITLLRALYDAVSSAVRIAGSMATIPAPVVLGTASETFRVAKSVAHAAYEGRYLLGLGAWYRYMIRGNSVADDLNEFAVRPLGGAATTVAALARGATTRARAARDAVVNQYVAEVEALPNPAPLQASMTQAAATVQRHRTEFKRKVCLLIDRVVNSGAVLSASAAKDALDRVLADPEFDLNSAIGRSGGKHRKRTMHKRSRKHHKKSRKHRR